LPGHVYANVRQPPISTLNLAHMMPFSAVWAGPERDEYFQEPPLFFARTEGSTPFRFSLHVANVGHTLIVGVFHLSATIGLNSPVAEPKGDLTWR
jgi:type IV secretion system protein VirB4